MSRLNTNNTKLTFELVTDEDDTRPVYLVGNFNAWRENDETFQMDKVDTGRYRYTFQSDISLPEIVEYKYIRGEWADVELDKFGNLTGNRQMVVKRNKNIKDFVPKWANSGLPYRPSYLPKIEVIAKDFEIPQLIKTRRIAALLPHDYHKSEKSYPVIYLQDGQNLFDDYAPFGNWAVDKKLAVLAEKGMGDIIVISIDHAEEDRVVEFTPTAKTRLGLGAGKKYARFLADTLKPYVDKHFRTKTEREHTAIGGSSMGGLISIYAGFMYPEVYSKLMIFSPALWVAPKIPFGLLNFFHPQNMRVYLYAGGKESVNMIPNVRNFQETFERHSGEAKFVFKLSIDPQGRHTESKWGEEFPKAIQWLFFSKNENKEEDQKKVL